jgi:hypothetical protein
MLSIVSERTGALAPSHTGGGVLQDAKKRINSNSVAVCKDFVLVLIIFYREIRTPPLN